MRLQRIILIGVWALVSLLAVAGFAAFSSEGEPGSADDLSANGSTAGGQAGAVAAMGFSGTAGSPSITLSPAPSALAAAPTDGEKDRTGSGTPYLRGETLSQLEVRDLVTRYFEPEHVNRAMRVAWCSSGFNPTLVDPATGAVGLFPILPSEWRKLAVSAGVGGAQVTDPAANVAVAAYLVSEHGWGAWACRG